MKPVRDWTVEDLLQLPPGEQDWFERKGKKALDLTASGVDENHVRSELSTTLSAMANTGGGQIVFGLTNVGVSTTGGYLAKYGMGLRHGWKMSSPIPWSLPCTDSQSLKWLTRLECLLALVPRMLCTWLMCRIARTPPPSWRQEVLRASGREVTSPGASLHPRHPESPKVPAGRTVT